MGDALGTWLGIIGGIAGLVVLLAGLVVAAKGSYNKARITSLREDLDDSRKRETDRQGEVDSLTNRVTVCDAKIEGLLRENLVLKDLVTQRVELGALQGMSELHHEQAVAHWEHIENVLSELFARVEQLAHQGLNTTKGGITHEHDGS